jgi:hypothetical protein
MNIKEKKGEGGTSNAKGSFSRSRHLAPFSTSSFQRKKKRFFSLRNHPFPLSSFPPPVFFLIVFFFLSFFENPSDLGSIYSQRLNVKNKKQQNNTNNDRVEKGKRKVSLLFISLSLSVVKWENYSLFLVVVVVVVAQ